MTLTSLQKSSKTLAFKAISLWATSHLLAGPLAARASEVINTTPQNQCPVLGGKPGIAFTEKEARELRDMALIKLPACTKKVELQQKLIQELQGTVDALKLQNTLLEQSLALRKEQVDDLMKIAKPGSTNRALWFGLGALLGIGIAIGVVYAILPARPPVAISTPSQLGVRF